MGLFGSSTDAAVVDEVEQATSEKNVEEDWGVIMNICDKAGKSSENAKGYLKAITKRLYNSDPHIGLKAVTLLDACIKNSGKTFHVEVSSRDFETEFNKLLLKSPASVSKRLRESLKRWATNEFKNDPQLGLIPSLYAKLQNQGYDFSSAETPVKKSTPASKDPNVVESQEEEDQILKAIELSLKETSSSPHNSASSSLYPSVSNMANTPVTAKESRKVRALYDFEAAEDNELSFNSGEIIAIIDDSDPHWWKGSNQRGQGLFPANFVTADLSVEPEKFLYEKAKKMVQFKENAEIKIVEKEPEEVEINEQKIDRLLHLLHEADPTNPEKDTQELLSLEKEVNGMGPLIDNELERVDRKHAQLTQLSTNLVDALGLYHMLMREPQFPPASKGYGGPQSPTPVNFNGTLPHPMHHNPVMNMPNMPPISATNIPTIPGQDRPPFLPPYQVMGGLPPMGMGLPRPNMGPLPQQVMHHPPMPDDRQGPQNMPPQVMGHYAGPGIPNYGPPGMMPPNFQGGMPQSQTTLQNGHQQQPPHFVSSSTHTMH